jgi:hypothetical protein
MEFEKDLNFIIGFLKQSIELKYDAGKTLEILLFLAEEIENLKTKLGVKNGK